MVCNGKTNRPTENALSISVHLTLKLVIKNKNKNNPLSKCLKNNTASKNRGHMNPTSKEQEGEDPSDEVAMIL